MSQQLRMTATCFTCTFKCGFVDAEDGRCEKLATQVIVTYSESVYFNRWEHHSFGCDEHYERMMPSGEFKEMFK